VRLSAAHAANAGAPRANRHFSPQPVALRARQVARCSRPCGSLAAAPDGGLGDLLEQPVSLAVGELVSMRDGGEPEGLSEVALAGTG
jgi:hypothetical protein